MTQLAMFEGEKIGPEFGVLVSTVDHTCQPGEYVMATDDQFAYDCSKTDEVEGDIVLINSGRKLADYKSFILV